MVEEPLVQNVVNDSDGLAGLYASLDELLLAVALGFLADGEPTDGLRRARARDARRHGDRVGAHGKPANRLDRARQRSVENGPERRHGARLAQSELAVQVFRAVLPRHEEKRLLLGVLVRVACQLVEQRSPRVGLQRVCASEAEGQRPEG